VKVNGAPIDDYHLKPAPATITYTLEFEEAQARAAAGVSYDEYQALPGTPMWIDRDNPVWSKCHYLIWYRRSQQIPAVSSDAHARSLERKRKNPRF